MSALVHQCRDAAEAWLRFFRGKATQIASSPGAFCPNTVWYVPIVSIVKKGSIFKASIKALLFLSIT